MWDFIKLTTGHAKNVQWGDLQTSSGPQTAQISHPILGVRKVNSMWKEPHHMIGIVLIVQLACSSLWLLQLWRSAQPGRIHRQTALLVLCMLMEAPTQTVPAHLVRVVTLVSIKAVYSLATHVTLAFLQVPVVAQYVMNVLLGSSARMQLMTVMIVQ